MTRDRGAIEQLAGTIGATVLLLSVAGCSIGGGTLGGREKCWPADPPRAASLWRGLLQIDEVGGQLWTPEGDVIPLLPGRLTMRVGMDGTGELVEGDRVVAKEGDDVTLWGGAGSDGYLVVCDLDELHASS